MFHALILALKWGIILLALAVIWLSVWGLPRSWLDRALAELSQHGIYLHVSRARLDIFNGLAFEDVALYESPKAATPLLAAEKIRVFINPRDWQRGEHGIRAVSIKNGMTCLPLGYARLPSLTASNIHARLRVEGGDLRLADWSFETLGAFWRGRGLVHNAFTGPAVSPQKVDLVSALAPLRRQEPAWLEPVLAFRREISLPVAPTLDFNFLIQRAMPASNQIHAVLQGNAAGFRGVHFSPWQVDLTATGALFHVAATLRQDRKRLTADGWIDMDAAWQTWVNVFCDLPTSQVLALLPPAWRQTYTNSGVRVYDSASMDVRLGPAPPAHLLEQGEVSCRIQSLVAAGVPMAHVRAQLRRNGNDLTVSNITAEVGVDRQRGTLNGQCAVQLKTKIFTGQAHTTFDPQALLPVVGSGTSNLISLMRFDAQPPIFDLGVTGISSDLNRLVVTGRVAAADFTFRGERVVLATSAFRMAHGVLDLPDAQVVREDGSGRGRVTYNMDDDLLELEATGSAPPHPVAHMIAPGLSRIIQRFTFNGPIKIAVHGRVSVGASLEGTDLRVSAEGEQMGWRHLLADHASFDLIAVGSHFTFTNVHGVFCGGTFQGAADFSNVEEPTNCRYTADVILTKADFTQVYARLHPGANRTLAAQGVMRGELTGQAQLTGRVEPWQSVEGHGEVYIHNGSIFQFRLFGGLSKLLGKIYPGLGYLSQTEFHMPFTVRQQRLHADDISIKGDIISLHGRGDYHFGQNLDFQVQVQPLRNGTLADILRVVTFPVTKLLEFKLVGTLDDPRWRPVNLPKELFLQFD